MIKDRVGVISPNPNLLKGSSPESLAGSLHLKKYSRFPGSVVIRFPYRESNNSYRTGLDVNADYIKRLPENEQKREKQIVKELAELAEEYYPDFDVTNPRSSFWSNMSKSWGEDRMDVAEVAKMVDGDNFYPMKEPMRLIQYAFLRVHPAHAPSSKKLKDPKYSKATFYVNDEDTELQDEATLISTQNKYRTKFFTESPENKRIYARLLGYAITDGYGEDRVTVVLEEYISEIREPGDAKCRELDEVLGLKIDELKARDIVRQAILHAVVRKGRDGSIYEGENKVGDSEVEYVHYLLAAKNKEEYSLLKSKLKDKKGINK